MIDLEIALTVNFIAKLLIFLIYLYIYFQYKEKFIGYWAVAWGFLFLKSVIDPFVFNSPLEFIFAYILANASILFFVRGTWVFTGKEPPKLFIAIVLVNFLVICTGSIFNYSLTLLILPFVFIFGTIHIITGIFLLRNKKISSLSLKITAYAFIVNGLHQFDFPLIRDTPLAFGGFLFDSMLRFIIAFWFLFTYFEKIKNDLEGKDKQLRFLAEKSDILYRYQTVPTPKFEYISPTIVELTGYPQEEYYNDPFLLAKSIHPDDISLLNQYGQPRLNNRPVPIKIINKDQTLQWVELYAIPGGTPLRSVEYVDCILKDVTLEKQIEHEILRLDGLNMVGQMAVAFVDELKDSITVIYGYLQLLPKIKDVTSANRIIDIMIKETAKADLILNQYLSLTKERPSILKPADLNEVINDVMPLIEIKAIGYDQKIVTSLSSLSPVLLDKNEIRQVVLNLALNGFEAMQPGKTLTIHTFMKNGEVVLAVEDEGKGIDAENLSKVGIPFFTTKQFGKGLGLAVCHAISAHHGAVLDISSVPGKTVVSLQFKPYRQNNLVLFQPKS